MLPKHHALIGFLFSLILIYFFNFSILAGAVVFLSSVLIDVDHYLYYVCKKKDLSLKNAYTWFFEQREKFRKLSKLQKKKFKTPIMVLHGIEFWVLIFILSFFHQFFFWIFLGITIHMLVDYAEIIYEKDPLSIKLSLIFSLLRNKSI